MKDINSETSLSDDMVNGGTPSGIEAGSVNCVICKTLSRAFRNYSDQGFFLENFFPRYKTRFISIGSPHIDSFLNPDIIHARTFFACKNAVLQCQNCIFLCLLGLGILICRGAPLASSPHPPANAPRRNFTDSAAIASN